MNEIIIYIYAGNQTAPNMAAMDWDNEACNETPFEGNQEQVDKLFREVDQTPGNDDALNQQQDNPFRTQYSSPLSETLQFAIETLQFPGEALQLPSEILQPTSETINVNSSSLGLIGSPFGIETNKTNDLKSKNDVIFEYKTCPQTLPTNRFNISTSRLLKVNKPSSTNRINKKYKSKRTRQIMTTTAEQTFERTRDIDAYKMIPGGQRLLIIFNWRTFENSKDFETREGSKKDVVSLKTIFEKLGFKIEKYSDLSRQKFIDKLEELRQRTGVDALVVAIMSHGDGKDTNSFVTSDCESFSMDNVLNMFTNANCPGLLGKPKLFLANFCRTLKKASFTKDKDEPMEVGKHSTESSRGAQVKQVSDMDWKDMCIIYGCDRDNNVLRDPSSGSIFIQTFLKVIENYDKIYNPHVNNLFLELQREMERECKRGDEAISLPRKVDYFFQTCYLTPDN